MRSWERALSVLEALCERGQAAGHGWTLDTELLPPHQQQVNALEGQGLVELACREDRAELSVLEGRLMRWAARLAPYGHDTLTYGRSRPRAGLSPGEAASDRQLVELIPSQMAALRVFVGLADQLRVPPADGLAEQVRTASCDHGIKRWRLYLTQEQMWSVAYGLWLHRRARSPPRRAWRPTRCRRLHSPDDKGTPPVDQRRQLVYQPSHTALGSSVPADPAAY
ncbi:DUF6417 family protein [Streptomyces mirabilis]|uniref:DUF6417 family protein n=1 Tax=Streptomyces mirabilis TaxID=68239 RepID=UPI0036B04316